MKNRYFVTIIFFLVLGEISGQIKVDRTYNLDGSSSNNDSTSVSRGKGYKKVATIDMYLKFNTSLDSTIVDTTISIKKLYKFNYLQKDNFGLMQFANIGQSYNTLSFDASSNNTIPLFGARARHFNYMEADDILYYEVPTPWTRLTYKTAFQQGQLLDAFFTVNLSRQFNFSIAYKGLRSLGNYQNSLTSTGNFRFTSSYNSKDGKYKAKGHIVAQDLLNQENGGLRDDDIANFRSGEEEFLDRSIFDPNFEDAENILDGTRFLLNQSYSLIKQNDSITKNELSVVNEITYEDKFYRFYQTTPSNFYFGDSFTDDIDDKVTLQNFQTSLGVNYTNNLLGELKFALNYTNINYGYNSIVILQDAIITNRIKTGFLGVEASYKKAYKGFSITGNGGLNLSDEFSGSYLDGIINFKVLNDVQLSGGISISSRLPNYNFLLYQSDYLNYNWNNLDRFDNVNTQQIKFSVKSQKYFNADLDITNIDNYTYFNLEDTVGDNRIVKPEQFTGSLQYLRLKVNKEFKFGNFALDNTLLFQNVISDEDVLNVPQFVTRNSFYYANELFKKALTFQTGVTLNYFTDYNMNRYDPLLAEFYTQNETKLGGFPRLDFFLNAKVRQTRIFLKVEHYNASITGYDYFSAPNYPFRDFAVRFGLVWDFFL